MPVSAPGPVSVALLSGQTATISPSSTRPNSHVQIEIPTTVGVFREAAWQPGSSRARNVIMRGASLVEADANLVETAAITLLESIATGRAAPTAAFNTLAVEIFARGSTERRTIPVASPDEFIALCEQPCSPNYFLEWKDPEPLALVDVDWHDAKRGIPLENDRYMLMTGIKPAPFAYHPTRRGFHALFAPLDGFTAKERASVALAGLLDHPLVAAYGGTAELITRTRHPQSEHNGYTYGRIRRSTQDNEMPALSCFSRVSCDEDEATEAREHLNLQVGRRYPHSSCPMRPEHRSSSADPVVVHPDGVHCFSCQRSWSWGTIRRRIGLPMRATAETSIIRDAIANWVPHTQVARYVEALAPWIGANLKPAARGDLIRTIHRTLIKRQFYEDPPLGFDLLLQSVFAPFQWVRSVDGLWLHEDSLRIVQPKPERIDMYTCSAAQFAKTTKEGAVALDADPHKASQLAKNGTLKGWMPILPVPVTPVWHVHNLPVTNGTELRVRATPTYRDPLAYIADPTARTPMAECERLIDRRFPGINFAYLRLLHIARGLGEQGACQLPIIWATGQTGTGKTSTAYVEAALHDEVPENLAGADVNKIRDMLGEAQGRTSCVTLDDFAKVADNKKMEFQLDQYLQFILQFNRSLTYHRRHVGMLNIPITSFLLMTDLKQPRAFMSNAQLGRRVAMVHLDQQCPTWSESSDGQARGGFKDWWRESAELRKAAESWHSWVVDEHLPVGASTEWRKHVEACGFQMLTNYADTGEATGSRHLLVKNFVHALLAAPVCEEVERHVFTGAKEIILNSDSALSIAARELVEYNEYDTVTVDSLRHVLEPYQGLLHQLLPLAMPCHIQIGRRCARIFVRLREQGKRHRTAAHINLLCLLPIANLDNLLLLVNE